MFQGKKNRPYRLQMEDSSAWSEYGSLGLDSHFPPG